MLYCYILYFCFILFCSTGNWLCCKINVTILHFFTFVPFFSHFSFFSRHYIIIFYYIIYYYLTYFYRHSCFKLYMLIHYPKGIEMLKKIPLHCYNHITCSNRTYIKCKILIFIMDLPFCIRYRLFMDFPNTKDFFIKNV